MDREEFHTLFDQAFRRWQKGGSIGLEDCCWAAFHGKFKDSSTNANEPYLVSSEVCSDTEIAVARSCGRFFTIGSFGYVVRGGR